MGHFAATPIEGGSEPVLCVLIWRVEVGTSCGPRSGIDVAAGLYGFVPDEVHVIGAAVPGDVAVVVLEAPDRSTSWQRPVGRMVLFEIRRSSGN